MLCFPNCKINIGLHITARRPDGYHNLETVFYPISFADALEIVPAAQTTLHTSGIAVEGDEDQNLVMKALNVFSAEWDGTMPNLDIYLHKAIPTGAGLGGGSSDGAHMLLLLNKFTGAGLSTDTLALLALTLGSDCPFFIYNRPALGLGRGETLQALPLDLKGYRIALVLSALHIGTREAFSLITPKPATFNLRTIRELPVTEWKRHIVNDFEAPILGRYPLLRTVKEALYDNGALYAAMSGSGSTIYGIFPQDAELAIALPEGARLVWCGTNVPTL